MITRKELNRITDFAVQAHDNVNQKYGNAPYSKHLFAVKRFAEMFSLYYVDIQEVPTVLAGAMTHDIIEDAQLTYNDVKKECGHEVAELAYALTNEKGKNRAERANNKYYDEMRQVKYATYIKLCDRLANAQNSLDEGSSMLKKYKKELPHFKLAIAESNNNFINWIFKRTFLRQMYPKLSMYFLNKNLKYKLMWEELETILN